MLERSDSVANHPGSCEGQDSNYILMEVYDLVESSEAPQAQVDQPELATHRSSKVPDCEKVGCEC